MLFQLLVECFRLCGQKADEPSVEKLLKVPLAQPFPAEEGDAPSQAVSLETAKNRQHDRYDAGSLRSYRQTPKVSEGGLAGNQSDCGKEDGQQSEDKGPKAKPVKPSFMGFRLLVVTV